MRLDKIKIQERFLNICQLPLISFDHKFTEYSYHMLVFSNKIIITAVRQWKINCIRILSFYEYFPTLGLWWIKKKTWVKLHRQQHAIFLKISFLWWLPVQSISIIFCKGWDQLKGDVWIFRFRCFVSKMKSLGELHWVRFPGAAAWS